MLHEHRFLVSGRVPALKVHREPRPAPAVVVLHGLGGSAETQRRELDSLAGQGLTALGLDAPHHGSRRDAWLDEMGRLSPPESHVKLLRLLLEALPEVTSALDHLQGEGHGPLGVLGISMGAYLALAAAAEDPRIRATVSILGSPSWAPRLGPITAEMLALMERAPAHRPAACARHPLLMINAGRDASVPPDLPGGPRDFARILRERHPALASRSEYLEYAESEHVMREGDWEDAWRRALAFLRAELREAAASVAAPTQRAHSSVRRGAPWRSEQMPTCFGDGALESRDMDRARETQGGRRMATRIVTISHTTGAAGDSIGRGVAERLGFRYVDEQIIEVAARNHGLDTGLVADAERRRGLLTRLLEDLGTVPILDLAGTAGTSALETVNMPRREELRALITEAIRETAESGNVVIVSHAAGIPLTGRDDVLRVLVTASFDTRARRVAADHDVPRDEAEQRLKESDAGRADYFLRFYRIERELPTHYDLVVNTDRFTPEEATDIVVAAAGLEA